MESLRIYNIFSKKGYLRNLDSQVINYKDCEDSKIAQSEDRDCFFINALITFASAINGINSTSYSWVFVQMYYTLFYLAKTQFAIERYSIFYENRKLYSIRLIPGGRFIKHKRNIHEAIFKYYNTEFPNDYFVKNEIDNIKPFDWFKNKREIINYRINPMEDPRVSFNCFEYKKSIRKWLQLYFNESEGGYTFSNEHAYVAMVVKFIDKIFSYYIDKKICNNILNDQHIKFFKNTIKDNSGPIDFIIEKIKYISNESR